jgi:hypothetical protein
MNKVFCAAIAAGLLLANNGSCLGGGVNSAGSSRPAQICADAARIGAAADVIAQALAAAGFAQEKIAALLPLIERGRLLITVTCTIVAPPAAPTPVPAPDAPPVTNAS